MSWRVARSLDVLLAEVNEVAPNRNRASDGSIGDAAHATRTSDHNPWVKDDNGVGVVRARDFTHDPANGLDCNALAKRLAAVIAAGAHPAARSGAYVIWNRRIFSYDRRTEGWRGYYGSNPHTAHLHLSVATTGYDSPAPWGWHRPTTYTRGGAVDHALRDLRKAKGRGDRAIHIRAARRALRKIRKWVAR